MQAKVELPKAFSVRHENELFPVRHLLARLNSQLLVAQVGTGKHVDGGCTVFWGLAYLEGQQITSDDVKAALAEAGFDFTHGSLQLNWLERTQRTAG